MKYLLIFAALSLFATKGCSQEQGTQDYEGSWVGTLPDKSAFNFIITIEKLESNTYHLKIANQRTLIDKELESTSENRIQIRLGSSLAFDLAFEMEGKELTGLLTSGKFIYHINLKSLDGNSYSGAWNSFMLDDYLISDDILLYIENVENGGMEAFPFFGDQRFRGTWTDGFRKENETLLFVDANTGFNYRAKLLNDIVELEILLADVLITETTLTYSKDDWEYETDPTPQDQNTSKPEQMDDGWQTAEIDEFGIDSVELIRMIDDVNAKELVNTHSVLIAKKEKLIFEVYFDGFNANIPHDQRSASKSVSSAIIGIAIDEGIIKSVDEKLYDFLPSEYQYTKDELKSKISIKDLLTMSSGLDVNNQAGEDSYQDSGNPDSWLKTVLEAPMVNEPGTYADYGSANPFLLGVCLNERLEKPLALYMDEKLFAPLGITNYINQTDDTYITPYFGGGLLLTPRDMLKFGQLYQNKGQWKGQQILSEKWVEESFRKHVQLQDVTDKNQYGYLWWHDTYSVNGQAIEVIEARGAGGQFIFVMPEIDAVVAITAGNFRNRKGNQSREILKEYILPALVN